MFHSAYLKNTKQKIRERNGVSAGVERENEENVGNGGENAGNLGQIAEAKCGNAVSQVGNEENAWNQSRNEENGGNWGWE